MDLPRWYSITSNEEDLNVIAKMISSIKEGGLSQIRAKTHTLTTIREILRSKMCGIFLLNSSSYDGTTLYPFQGIHLTSQDVKDITLIREIRSYGVKYIAASCHNEEEIAIANGVMCNFITISPVEMTSCHLDSRPIGWQQFAKLSALADMPVFALGGQSIDNLPVAHKFGAYGVSGVSKFW